MHITLSNIIVNKTWYLNVKIRYTPKSLHYPYTTPHYYISPLLRRNLRLQVQSNHISIDLTLSSSLLASHHPLQLNRSLFRRRCPRSRQSSPILPRRALDYFYIINVPLDNAVGSIILLMMGRQDVFPWADMDVCLMQGHAPHLVRCGTASEAIDSC